MRCASTRQQHKSLKALRSNTQKTLYFAKFSHLLHPRAHTLVPVSPKQALSYTPCIIYINLVVVLANFAPDEPSSLQCD